MLEGKQYVVYEFLGFVDTIFLVHFLDGNKCLNHKLLFIYFYCIQCSVAFDIIKTFGKYLNHARGLENTWPNKRKNQDTTISRKNEYEHYF